MKRKTCLSDFFKRGIIMRQAIPIYTFSFQGEKSR